MLLFTKPMVGYFGYTRCPCKQAVAACDGWLLYPFPLGKPTIAWVKPWFLAGRWAAMACLFEQIM